MSTAPIAAASTVSAVIEERCIGCGTCVLACTYGAMRLRDAEDGAKAAVDPNLCAGDGLCSSLCATGAIVLRNSPTDEIFRQIDGALGRS